MEILHLFGGVSYSMDVNGTNISGKTFTPTESGNIDVTLYATDIALNTRSKKSCIFFYI